MRDDRHGGVRGPAGRPAAEGPAPAGARDRNSTEHIMYAKIVPAVLAAVLFSSSAMAASPAGERKPPRSVSYRQLDGKTVTVKVAPRRVVIGYGSLAKVWDLAGGRAVAVPSLPSKEALPESMRNLPSSGTPQIPNVEAIAAMKPDLVLLMGHLPRHRDCAGLLKSMKIDAVCVTYNTYNDFLQLLDFFCRVNGRNPDDVPEAKKVIADVQSVCAKVKGRPAPRCALLFASAAGFSLESRSSGNGIMLEMLGGENILKQKAARRVKFSYEQLLLEDPDVIFVVTMGKAPMLKKKFEREFVSQPAWQSMKAVKNGRVHFLPSRLFLYMAGPDYPEAFRYMAELLYPDAERK